MKRNSPKDPGEAAVDASDGSLNNGFLRLEQVSKSYREGDQQRAVLRAVTAQFQRGEFAAILGKSGSGKTTLLNLISGIDRPDGGEIFVEGRSLSRLNDLECTLFRRQRIGFIFQFFNLIPALSVWENVMLPLELNDQRQPADIERAEQLLEAVGLAQRKQAAPDRLSGGEQQRVAIARALVHDPLLVLADEPTGNLDEDTGRQVLALLERLTRQANKNLILVTHSFEAAAPADRRLVLHDGQLFKEPAP